MVELSPIKKKRYIFIDILKAIGILVIISIHTNAYFLSNPTIKFLWDIGQLFVPGFICASAFLYFSKSLASDRTESFEYIIKRTVRLLPPYYIFLLFYFLFIYIGEGGKLTIPFIIPHLIFTGGIDSNWLVLLFIFFSALFPFIAFLFKNHRRWFYIAMIVSFLNAVLFLWVKTPLSYRITMVIPWLLLVFLTVFFSLPSKSSRKNALLFAFFFLCLGISRLFLSQAHLPLDFYENKYPPNLYYLSAGALFMMIIFFFQGILEKIPNTIKGIVELISKYTYSLYFLHQLVIYHITVIQKKWPTSPTHFFLEVTIWSLAIQGVLICLDRLRKVIVSQH